MSRRYPWGPVALIAACAMALACGDGGGTLTEPPPDDPPPAPALPQGIPDEGLVQGAVTFGWTASPGAVRYRVQLDDDPSFADAVEATVTTSRWTPAFEIPPGDYLWRVRAGGTDTWSDWTPAWPVTIRAAAPGPPTLLAPGNGSRTSVDRPSFQWTASAGATEHELQLDNDVGFASPDLSVTLETTSFTPSVSLTPRGYYWRVRSRLAEGAWGDWSPGWSFTIVDDLRKLILTKWGSGTVSSNPPGLMVGTGGSTAVAEFPVGQRVTLVAEPVQDWELAGWGGECADAGASSACEVELDSDRSVSVTFAPITHRLMGSVGGEGRLRSDPSGLDLVGPGTGAAHFRQGVTVGLTAEPAPGWRVAEWDGACSGRGSASTCDVEVAGPITAGVTFEPVSHTVVATISGDGALTSAPAGLDLAGDGDTDSAPFASGTTLTLTAAPAPGWQVGSWGGACDEAGTSATCEITVGGDTGVSVTFARTVRALDVSATGSGSVTSTPTGIAVDTITPADTAAFAHGTTVALTASPATGWTFAGWGGACSGTGTCTVAMDRDRSVTAVFTPVPLEVLVVARLGRGFVDSSPVGIRLDTTMVADSASFTHDTTVQLRARGAPGWSFAGWSGACSGKGTCTVKMTGLRFVTAAFVQSSGGAAGAGPARPAPGPSVERDAPPRRPVLEHRQRPHR